MHDRTLLGVNGDGQRAEVTHPHAAAKAEIEAGAGLKCHWSRRCEPSDAVIRDRIPKESTAVPTYQVVTSGVDLDRDQRDRLAKGTPAIHHAETQAPEPFVRVVFEPMPRGVVYTGGVATPVVVLNGEIRSGRRPRTPG